MLMVRLKQRIVFDEGIEIAVIAKCWLLACSLLGLLDLRFHHLRDPPGYKVWSIAGSAN